MEDKELVGQFRLKFFDLLPADISYYVRGQGVLARYDEIINGNTQLDKSKLQLFFETVEDRDAAIRKFAESTDPEIIGDNEKGLELHTENFKVRFFRDLIQDDETLVEIAPFSVLSLVLKRDPDGEVSMFHYQGVEQDVRKREFRSTGSSAERYVYQAMFQLWSAGFEVVEEQEVDPAKNWLLKHL